MTDADVAAGIAFLALFTAFILAAVWNTDHDCGDSSCQHRSKEGRR